MDLLRLLRQRMVEHWRRLARLGLGLGGFFLHQLSHELPIGTANQKGLSRKVDYTLYIKNNRQGVGGSLGSASTLAETARHERRPALKVILSCWDVSGYHFQRQCLGYTVHFVVSHT